MSGRNVDCSLDILIVHNGGRAVNCVAPPREGHIRRRCMREAAKGAYKKMQHRPRASGRWRTAEG